jgi:group I intron endonuclease
MYGFIYKIENLVNHKVYIGQTRRDVKVRYQEHLRGSHNKYLAEDLNIYGKDNFILQILDCADSQKELGELEIFWISYFKAMEPNFGYNQCSGGKGPKDYSWSEQSCLNVSEQRQGCKWVHKGNERHLVHKDKLHLYSEYEPGYGPGRTHKSPTKETRAKMSAWQKGVPKKRSSVNKLVKSLKSAERHWYTNGKENKLLSKYQEVPEGFYRGKFVTQEFKDKISRIKQENSLKRKLDKIKKSQ